MNQKVTDNSVGSESHQDTSIEIVDIILPRTPRNYEQSYASLIDATAGNTPDPRSRRAFSADLSSDDDSDIAILEHVIDMDKEIMQKTEERLARIVVEQESTLDQFEAKLRNVLKRSFFETEIAIIRKTFEDLQELYYEKEYDLKEKSEQMKYLQTKNSKSEKDFIIMKLEARTVELETRLMEMESNLARAKRQKERLENICDQFDDDELRYKNTIRGLEEEVRMLKGIKTTPKGQGKLLPQAFKNSHPVEFDNETTIVSENSMECSYYGNGSLSKVQPSGSVNSKTEKAPHPEDNCSDCRQQ